jgi:hypothetical protein
MNARLNRFVAVLAFAIATSAADLARAQTYSVNVTSSAALGNVVSGASGDTTFDLAAATGTVTRLSGSGVRTGSGSARATVQVSCSGLLCGLRTVNIRLGSTGSPTRRARALSDFDVAMGTASLATAASGTNPVSFTINAVPNGGNRTFYVGASFPIAGDDSGLATGDATSGFYVYAAASPTTPTASISDTDAFTATVYRPISITKTSDLNIGRVVKPTSGSGLVTIDAATGARTVTTGIGVSTPVPTHAAYTVTGEGGRAVAITLPTTVTITNGASASLALSMTTTTTGSATLSNAGGSQGTYSFGVGGSFTLSSATPSGAYSGAFNVTANYN